MEDNGMTYGEQVVADNTWKKHSEKEIDFCEYCDCDTEHYTVSGSTVWDRYSYQVCCKCGKSENEIARHFWRAEQAKK